MPASSSCRTRRRVASLLATTASASRLTGFFSAQEKRCGNQLVQHRAAAVRTRHLSVRPRERLELGVTILTTVFVDWHRSPYSSVKWIRTAGGRASVLTRVACRATPASRRFTSSGGSGSMQMISSITPMRRGLVRCSHSTSNSSRWKGTSFSRHEVATNSSPQTPNAAANNWARSWPYCCRHPPAPRPPLPCADRLLLRSAFRPPAVWRASF